MIALFFHLSNIDLTTPLSINVANMFFKTIKIIGPTNIPIIPINLNPVYIAIKVNIGCIPIFPPTILGSINCRTTDIIIHKTKIHNARFKSPEHAVIIAHGIMKVPAPKIGSKSTKPIIRAINNGYSTFNPKNDKYIIQLNKL